MERVAIGIPRCLARAEALYNTVKNFKKNNKPMILMNCYDAVL